MKTVKQSKKYQRLLDAAVDLFMKRGCRHVAVEEIAAEAGISKVTLYNYFSSKEQLFIHCVKILTDRHYEQLQDALSQKSRATEKIALMFQFNLEQRNRYSEVFIADMFGMVHVWKEAGPYRAAKARKLCTEILEEGTSADEFHILSIPRTIDLLLSFSEVLTKLYPYDHPEEQEDFLKNMYAFLTGALTCQVPPGGFPHDM